MLFQKNIGHARLSIGGKSQFIPQLEIEGWGKASTALSFVDPFGKSALVSNVSDSITLDNDSMTNRWFPQEDNSYEWEIVLKQKPPTNVLRFTLQQKGTSWHCQPALTSEQIAAEYFRPENVVNSYAVYMDDVLLIGTGATKAQRTGKLFHLYRFSLTTKNEKKIWLDKISIGKTGLELIIPQEILDTAEYPLTIGPNFGITANPASSVTQEGKIFGFNASPAQNGMGISIDAYVRESTTPNIHRWKGNLYNHADNTAITNATTEQRKDLTTSWAWQTFNFVTRPLLLSSLTYIVCMWASGDPSGNSEIGYDTVADAGEYQVLAYSSWPDPLVPSHVSERPGIHCEYGLMGNYYAR